MVGERVSYKAGNDYSGCLGWGCNGRVRGRTTGGDKFGKGGRLNQRQKDLRERGGDSKCQGNLS